MESFGCTKWEHVCVTKDRLQIMDRDNGGTGIKDTTDERNSKWVQLKRDSAPEQVKTPSKAGAKGRATQAPRETLTDGRGRGNVSICVTERRRGWEVEGKERKPEKYLKEYLKIGKKK